LDENYLLKWVSSGWLSTLITEPRIFVEPKGRDAHSVPNRLHLVMASNNDWIVPAGHHERRFCVLDVTDSRRQDHGHFAAIRDQLDGGGYEAMLQDLLALDLSRFNIRKVPQTEALQEQTLQSLKPQELWWLDQLRSRDWWRDQGPTRSASVEKAVMAMDFSINTLGRYNHGSKTKLGIMLGRVLPADWPKTETKMNKATLRMTEYYLLPPLAEAREHFEHFTGLRGLFEDAEQPASVSNGGDLPSLSGVVSMSEEKEKRRTASGESKRRRHPNKPWV
jgi:hypothetical protein